MPLPLKLMAAALAAGALIAVAATADAHKAVTSRYTFNDDVYQILLQRCGRCHAEGGPAPMSLLTYNENGGAVAWAQAIKEMLIANAMPPYAGDPRGPAVRGQQTLTPRELDTLLTWASGGTPRGDLNHTPVPPKLSVGWLLGPPDLVLPLPSATTLAAGEMERRAEFVVATNLSKDVWVRAADLLPETPGVVRQATIAVENGPVLAVWEPQHEAMDAPEGTGFRLPPGAKLQVGIRYRKSWQDEQQTKTDRSSLGLYFVRQSPTREIGAVVIDDAAGSVRVQEDTEVLSVRVSVDQAYAGLTVIARPPSGREIPLLRLKGARPEWPRRYWLESRVELPAGSSIGVDTTNTVESEPVGPKVESPFQIAVETVPSRTSRRN